MMFQTSPGSADLVRLWANHAISPSGNSLSEAIYRLLPNDTDLSVSLARNIAGINGSFIGGHFDYHSTTDSVATIDRGSLQHLGDFTVTTTRALAMAASLPARNGDSVYFDLFGLTVVQYALWFGWVPLFVAGLSLIRLYRGTPVITVRQGIGGAAIVLVATVVLGGLGHVIGKLMIGSGTAQLREAMASVDIMAWPMGGLALAAILLLRPGRAMQLGAIAMLLLLGILAQIFIPGAAMLFAWPALIAVGMASLVPAKGRASIASTIGLVIVAGVVLGLLFQIIASGYVGVGLLSGAIIAPLLPYMIALLGPFQAAAAEPDAATATPPVGVGNRLSSALRIRTPGLAVMALCLGTFGWLAITDGFSVRHPRPGDFFALHDVSTGRSYWATASDASYLPAGEPARFDYEPFTRWRMLTVPADGLSAPGPDRRMRLTHMATPGGQRWTITIPTSPRFMQLALRPSAPLRNMRLNGRPISIRTDEWTRLFYRVPQPITLNLTAEGPADATMTIRYIYATPGLPAGAPRHPGLQTNWTILSGSQVIVGQLAHANDRGADAN
jgi:hypothetical protein